MEAALFARRVDAIPAAVPDPRVLLALRGIEKSFGSTRAVKSVDMAVSAGEVLGLMGGNGAGKSTLMKIVGGLIAADEGNMEIGGRTVGSDHSPRDAMRNGIRFVHQELSLCANLRIYESFAVEMPDIIKGLWWRLRARNFAKAALDDLFPDNRLDPRAKVGSLSLSEQQMVEIARAASHPGTKLLILDEPTSSLGSHQGDQLRTYVRRRREDGLAFIFISHRLADTLDLADRIIVMRNGAVASSGATEGIDQRELLRLLGGAAVHNAAGAAAGREGSQPLIRIENAAIPSLRGLTLQVARGEIVGLAGLEGGGQRELLRAIFDPRANNVRGVRVAGTTAFVSGDRVNEGIFPLWSIEDNIAISSLNYFSRFGLVSLRRMREVSAGWFERLQVRAPNAAALITSLSGGNQQKVVIARALAARADIVLLDDPTRGVDVGTKAELYGLFRNFAAEGCAVLWYSTDDAEFVECDRTIVMRDGVGVAEYQRHEISRDGLIASSFQAVDEAIANSGRKRRTDLASRRESVIPTSIPLVTFAVIFGACVFLNSDILSRFGMTLVFSAAFSLAFASISQLFVIAAGDIDLGIGPYIGLVNAIAATWLVTDPGLAVLCFAGLLIAYPLLGIFIQARGVPAIIVTLGMSFVWLGLASLRLPRAGGAAPGWLIGLFRIYPALLPLPVYLCLFPAVCAYLVLMVWRYGAVLRGFGASPRAIEAAGWLTKLAKATLYAFAGIFALLAGVVITASTRGGDPTGATSITLLSVAAVVLGGASFSGGVVAPIGALFGVLTLVLVGTLLSQLGVDGVYLAMVQGMMLLGVVGMRTLLVRRPA